MGSNVFGSAITDETLRGMAEYHDKPDITIDDRAKVALLMKNAEGKDVNAKEFGDSLAQQRSDGTVCLVYNATGRQVKLVAVREWNGTISASPYPITLLNGQWGVFFHEKIGNISEAALVFVFVNNTNIGVPIRSQWVFAWQNQTNQRSKCFVEIRDGTFYSAQTLESTWQTLRDNLNASSFTHSADDRSLNSAARASMTNTDPRVLEVILQANLDL